MEYRDWAPRYEQIRREFGFTWPAERRSASTLLRLLKPADRLDPLARVRRRLEHRDVIVVGLAPGAGPPPLWRRPANLDPPALVAADGATETCLSAGLVPALVVTDLDGPVASEVVANGRGALVVVHAHGDNVAALEEWVPQFPGELAGSWAGRPRPSLIDVGGFTDGDRAAYLAAEVGARRVLLWGFDFERVGEPDRSGRKRAKLAWARTLLNDLARHGPVPVLRWERDGSLGPLPLPDVTERPRRPNTRPRGRSRTAARTGPRRTTRSPRS